MDADSSNQYMQSTNPATGGDSNGGGSDSPHTQRRSLPSPWAQVVRGEPESSSSSSSLPVASAMAPSSPSSSSPPTIAASASAPATSAQDHGSHSASSDSSVSNAQTESSVENGGNAAPPRRPAWSRPVNGVVEPVSVMGGAVSWPALSESTRPSMRSTPDSSRPISNGSSSASQGPIVNQAPRRQVNAPSNAANASATPNSNANNAMPGRQRSMRHRGGGGGGGNTNHNAGGSSHGGFNRPPPPPPPPLPPPFPVIEIPYGSMIPPVVMDSPVRGPRLTGGPQPHVPNDHSSQRNSSRRGHFGPRPRGDGSYHNNHHGGRRDQDRRDVHVQQFVPPTTAFIPPPPPVTPPPYGPLPMRPFPGPMGFDMASPFIYVSTLPPESFRGVPLIAQAPPPPMIYPPNLPVMIVNQIDYYFSDENLVKDDFLRSNMDDEGWVSISLIANFPRVAQLTSSTEFILECLKASTVVEIQDDKLRRRDDWRRWIRTPARFNSGSGSHTTGELTENILANSIQNVSLDNATISRNSSIDAVDAQADTDPHICPSGEFTGQSELANGDATAEDISSSQSGTVVS